MAKGVRACLYEMLKEDIMTDVTFVVQGTEIRAHRNIASSRGGWLREMLEKKEERVEICDEIAPHTFRTILEYLYTDDCVINHLNLFELMHAAWALTLEELEKICAEAVKTKLAITNVGAFAAQALNFDAKEYLKICQEYFKKHTWDIIWTEEFLEISNKALVALLSTEGIVCSELQQFAVCIKWAKNACQQQDPKNQGTPEDLRAVLGDALDMINFSNIPTEDFLDFVVTMKILTNEEVGRVIVERQMQTQHLNSNWTDVVTVQIRDYRKYSPTDTILTLPLSTRISGIKRLKIFEGGTRSYPADKFTLTSGDTHLTDNMTLASIRTTGMSIIFLQVHSITITVEEMSGEWEFPLTIETQDLWERDFNVIKGLVYGLGSIEPDEIDKIAFKKKFPGATAVVYLT